MSLGLTCKLLKEHILRLGIVPALDFLQEVRGALGNEAFGTRMFAMSFRRFLESTIKGVINESI